MAFWAYGYFLELNTLFSTALRRRKLLLLNFLRTLIRTNHTFLLFFVVDDTTAEVKVKNWCGDWRGYEASRRKGDRWRIGKADGDEVDSERILTASRARPNGEDSDLQLWKVATREPNWTNYPLLITQRLRYLRAKKTVDAHLQCRVAESSQKCSSLI